MTQRHLPAGVLPSDTPNPDPAARAVAATVVLVAAVGVAVALIAAGWGPVAMLPVAAALVAARRLWRLLDLADKDYLVGEVVDEDLVDVDAVVVTR
jgi:hypothetical protein